jgi:hypothetical protein
MSVVADAAASRPSLRGPAVLISLAALGAVIFFVLAAAPYLLSSAYNANQYAGRRGPLLVHIAFGTVALFTGPIQLWLGIAERRMQLHRQLGMVYIAGVTGGATAAYVIALSPSAGWIFGAGLMGLATAWLTTTLMAFLAIKRSLMEQHKEWMIRSYVVTFAFVFFRVGSMIMGAVKPEAALESAQTLAWASWAVPLLVTELILQGQKILRVAAH